MNSDTTAQTEGPLAYPRAAPLELRNVRKHYPGAPRPAIEDLTLEIPAGEELLPANGGGVSRDGTATVDAATSLRDAASLMLADGNRPLTVVDGEGTVLGRVSLELISAALDRHPSSA